MGRVKIENIKSLNELKKVIEEGKIDTPMKAIMAKCIDCSCYDKKEVKYCECTSCPLHNFRLGSNLLKSLED